MSTFEIHFSPRESAARDPLDRVAEAEVGIFVGDLCLTELEDRVAKTVRPTLRASTYRLAFWLAENWWRLRWEPESDTLDWQLSHNLAAAGAGYVWPALTLVSDGECVALRMRPSSVAPTEDIRYLLRQDVRIPAESFVSGVDRFIGAVIERMRSTGHEETELERLWNELLEERQDTETAHWRKLESLAGLDPGAEANAFLDALLPQQSSVGLSGLEELIAACKQATQDTLNTLAAIREQGAPTLELPDIESLRERIQKDARKQSARKAHGGPVDLPWQRAYHAADAARTHWGLGAGAISSAQLAEILGTEEQRLLTPTTTTLQISAGFRQDFSPRFAVALGARTPTGRRFALARLLGDYLATSDAERLLPATAAKTARQKFQRAFAQQLLCPVDDLMAFLDTGDPNDDQIEEAAIEFDVSPLLIKTTLVNHGLVDRQVLQSF
jgi:Zn-dependent peptidase ImmA (M78 family)